MLKEIFEDHIRVANASVSVLLPKLRSATELAGRCLQSGGKILIAGNGGSAADAQHFAAEMVGRFTTDRAPIRAIALTVDTSAITAIANDYGFEQVFERQVEAFASEGDLFLAISTSGDSTNVIKAALKARQVGCRVVALTGASGGELAENSDLVLSVPSRNTARIQEIHELCLHALAEWLDRKVSQHYGQVAEHQSTL